MTNLKWLTSIFEKGKHTARLRPATAPQLRPIPTYLLTAQKIESIKVLISSPLKQLAEIRGALIEHLRYLPGVDPVAFEHHARVGETPDATSRRYVEQCDVFVMLIGEDEGSSATGLQKTYSQIEYEAMVERQGVCNGRPRVLIFAQEKLERQLRDWEKDAIDNYGVFHWQDEDQLLLRAPIDILASVISERMLQAGALLQERDKKSKEIDLLEERERDVLSLLKSKEQSIESLTQSLRASESTVQRWVDRPDPQRMRTWQLAAWTLSCTLVGVAAGHWMANRISPGEIGTVTVASPDLNAASLAVERIAATFEGLPAHIQSKAVVARQLNSTFTCADKSRIDYSVDGVPSAWFSRRDVCEGYGAVLLRMSAETSACAVDVIPEGETTALAERLAKSGLRLDAVRVLGHASQERISAPCPQSPRLASCLALASRDDYLVDSNDKLAAARAELFACDLEAALRSVGATIPRFERSGFGTLNAGNSGASSASHRKVDVELYASTLP